MNKRKIQFINTLILVLCCTFSAIQAQYILQTSSFTNGSAKLSDTTNYQMHSSAGQTLIGQSENDDYMSNAGFWFQSYSTIVAVDDPFLSLPRKFQLNQNYPNPFNPATTIEYAIAKRTHVRIDVYNALGQRVTTLVNAIKQPGYYSVILNANELASGLYFYRMYSNDFTKVKKLMVLK